MQDLYSFALRTILESALRTMIDASRDQFRGKSGPVLMQDQFRLCTDAQGRLTVVRGQIWPNFKLSQALMYVIISCKYENDLIKNSQEKVATPFFPL